MVTLTNNYMARDACPSWQFHDFKDRFNGQVDHYVYTGPVHDMFNTPNEQLKCFLSRHQIQKLVLNCDWEGGFNIPEEIIFDTINQWKSIGVDVVLLIQNERLSKIYKNIFYIHRCWWMQTAGWNDHVININNYQQVDDPEYKFNYILGTPRQYKINFLSQPKMIDLLYKHGVTCNLSCKIDIPWQQNKNRTTLLQAVESVYGDIDSVIKSRAVDQHKISTSHNNKLLYRDEFQDLDINMQLFFAALPYCYANSRFSVVQETEMITTTNRYTEKTIRPIELGQMFLLAGNYKCLQLLRADGFETFSQWIDEQYDIEPNNISRGKKVIDQIMMLCSLSDDQWSELQHEIKPVVEHNKRHLKSLRPKYAAALRNAIDSWS